MEAGLIRISSYVVSLHIPTIEFIFVPLPRDSHGMDSHLSLVLSL